MDEEIEYEIKITIQTWVDQFRCSIEIENSEMIVCFKTLKECLDYVEVYVVEYRDEQDIDG